MTGTHREGISQRTLLSMQGVGSHVDYESGWSEFDRAYRGRLTRYAAVKMGGDLEAASDVVQDTFLKAYEGLSSIVGVSPASRTAWMHTVTRNAIINQFKKQARAPEEVEFDDHLEHYAANGDPVAHAIFNEDLGRIISEVHAHQVVPLFEVLLGGRSYREIAEGEGSTESSVKSRIFRGREAAKRILEN